MLPTRLPTVASPISAIKGNCPNIQYEWRHAIIKDDRMESEDKRRLTYLEILFSEPLVELDESDPCLDGDDLPLLRVGRQAHNLVEACKRRQNSTRDYA